MKKETKQVIAASVIAAALIGAKLLFGGTKTPEMTVDEYERYISMMDYEAKKDPKPYTNVKTQSEIVSKMEKRALARAVKEKQIVINGKSMTAKDYQSLRKSLTSKTPE